MEVTLDGISIEVNSLQPQNASSPIDVTESGIIDVLHPVIKVFVFLSIKQLFSL